MYKYFLKPLGIVIGVYFVAALGVVANIYQLTNYNLLDTIKKHLPQSSYIIIAATLLLYVFLVTIEYIRNKPKKQPPSTHVENQKIEVDKIRKYYYGNQQSISARDIIDSTITQNIVERNLAGPLVDQRINDEIELIRQSRFFFGFEPVNYSLALARKLVEGELSNGSDEVRSRALAWCVRFISAKELDKAEEYINLAKRLGESPEIKIAEAFIISQKGDENSALSILADIDLPLSRTSSLMIVAHHESPQLTVNWMQKAGIDASELDSDGRNFLLNLYLQLAHWEAAQSCINILDDDDLLKTPILNHMVAITCLISTVPIEYRTVVLNQLPLDAARFPLAADAASIEARRKARHHFIAASEVAKQLEFPILAAIDDEYALWLELLDPDEHDSGMQRLENKLRDPKPVLRLVRLGLDFGIKFNLDAVEREIERQIAIHGGITQDAAIARFALAFTKKTPQEVADYIEQYRDELDKYIDREFMQYFQIEMLSKAGLPEKAKDYLDILVKEGLSEPEQSRLRRIIAEAEGANPIDARKEQFKQSDSLGDLLILVEELEAKGDWDGLCKYGEILFERTRSLRDGERLGRALANAQRNERIVGFLKANSDLLTQSKNLQMLYCWSLYNEGALLESRSELMKLRDEQDNPNYRALKVNLGITTGDWSSLSSFIENEYQEKYKRSAQELIVAAQLALHVGSPQAKDLIFTAAEKGSNDPDILVNAYLLASNAGWEDNAAVFQWLNKAAELSGEDGPIQKKSLKDIQTLMPEWVRQETETWQLLGRGEIPMFLAAQLLKRSLINIMLVPALVNLSENDPRRRGAILAYSGRRLSMPLKMGGAVAMDATTLLTLSFLNLLDKALDAFDTVYISHSTLNWLFEEKKKAVFHQPSRYKGAHQIQHFLSTGILEKLSPRTVPDSELAAQVGDELALLIAEAEKDSCDNDIQRIVVRSSPVHRLTSLMDEEVDLTEHAAVLSSCQAIINKLRQNGQITAEDERKALVYLQFQEKPWPNQPEIADRATLYMDDLTVTYFLHIGIIENLNAAGFKLIISPRAVSEANELISYQGISAKILNIIESIRSTIQIRIESGKIKVGKRHVITEPEKQLILDYPIKEVFDIARSCEAVFADDRFINQNAYIDYCSTQTPIFTTLDLLDALVSIGFITTEERFEHKTMLRRAGYCFIPVSDEELPFYIKASAVKDGKLVESAELKAIRESILRVRMSTFLQLPQEIQWLDALLRTFIRVLYCLWASDADISETRVRSNWILDQIDIRGWAQSFGREAGENIAKTGYATFIQSLLSPPGDTLSQIKDEYWSWVEEKVLAPLKEKFPVLYSSIIEWYRTKIANITEAYLKDSNITNPYAKFAIANAALKLLPPIIRTTLIEDSDFQKEYSIVTDAEISLSDGVFFKRSEICNAAKNLLSDRLPKDVTDMDGHKWELKNISGEGEQPTLELTRDKQNLILNYLASLSSDSTIRLRYLDETALDVNLPSESIERWRNILLERAFKDDEVDAFQSDIQDTPVERNRSLGHEIFEGHSTVSSLVPNSRRYFERLVGAYDGSGSICDYATSEGRTLFKQLSKWRPYDGFLLSLLLSSHSALTAEINVDHLGSEDLVRAFESLDKYGDRISQLGAIEVGLRIIPSRPEIEPILIRLIEQIRDDDYNSQDSGFKLISALFVLVDGELSRTRLFTSEPPFYRRLAALSHAALIHRQLVNSGVNIDSFSEWAFDSCGGEYYLQSLVDMRSEPRWNPDLAAASQMKAEFFGRIIFTAMKYEQNIKGSRLFDLILDTSSRSLQSLSKYPYIYYPGPLEGGVDTQIILPAEISEAIETQLSEEEVGPSSFVALVNSALIFRIGPDQTELAAKALKFCSYRLANVKDRSQLLSILNGLSTVAAIARSCPLADELRILVRRYRRDLEYPLSIEDAIRICLVAASSRAGLNDWIDFVGDWLTELAFGDLVGNDGKVLHSRLQYLCHVVPELWVSCGRAEAALKSYIRTC